MSYNNYQPNREINKATRLHPQKMIILTHLHWMTWPKHAFSFCFLMPFSGHLCCLQLPQTEPLVDTSSRPGIPTLASLFLAHSLRSVVLQSRCLHAGQWAKLCTQRHHTVLNLNPNPSQHILSNSASPNPPQRCPEAPSASGQISCWDAEMPNEKQGPRYFQHFKRKTVISCI